MFPEPTSLHTVWMSLGLGLATQVIGPLLRALSKQRLENRRARLESVAAREEHIDASYERLERENIRLDRECSDLRTALQLERDQLEEAREGLERLQARNESYERVLRMMGKKPEEE